MACDLFDNDYTSNPPCPPGGCKRDIVQCADITVPVDFEPRAVVGRIETECCGDPIVECRQEHCGNTCKITIRQKLCVTIPITYSAISCAKNPTVICCTGDECCD